MVSVPDKTGGRSLERYGRTAKRTADAEGGNDGSVRRIKRLGLRVKAQEIAPEVDRALSRTASVSRTNTRAVRANPAFSEMGAKKHLRSE